MKRINNAAWCCEQIEEKLKQWKAEVEKSRNTRHYEDEVFESGRRIGMEEIIHDQPKRIKKKKGENLINNADSIEYQDNEIFGRLSLYGVTSEKNLIHNLLFPQLE